METHPDKDQVYQLKQKIIDWLESRKQEALEKLKEGDPKIEAIQNKYEFDTWLADAARRVAQIQVATHTIKGQHQFAKGTSIYYQPQNQRSLQGYIGSDALSDMPYHDVVGNAAALDVYQFLSVSFDNETLLSRALRQDPILLAALHEDKTIAATWLAAFASVTESQFDIPQAHTFIKQVYWPLTADHYHLLVPLYPSSFMHHIYLSMRDKRFSDEAAEIRKAHKENTPHDGIDYYFPDLAMIKLGGANPQNISLLNSRRGGRAYLLPSLPPNWTKANITLPLKVKSIFSRHFSRLPRVYTLMRQLSTFLSLNPRENQATRKYRDEQIEAIIDALVDYVFSLRSLPAGWTKHEDCQLNQAEIYWLDPERDDIERPEADEWLDEVKSAFARWLNRALQNSKIKLAHEDYLHWKQQLADYIQCVDRFDMEVFA